MLEPRVDVSDVQQDALGIIRYCRPYGEGGRVPDGDVYEIPSSPSDNVNNRTSRPILADTMPYPARRIMTRSRVALMMTSIMVMPLDSPAQQLEPRLYSNSPVGMNFLLVGYTYASGSVLMDPSISLENAQVEIHSPFLGYAHALDIGGTSGKIDFILPYAWASGSADYEGQHYERDVSGFADPRIRFSVNLYGAPALTPEEFVNYRQNFIVGASLQVSLPLGQYDDDRLLNIGTNRWSIKPELGISKALGSFIFELSAAVTFYTDNDDFFGGSTRTQDPLYSVEGHVIYSFQSGIWIAVDGTYYTGGRTSTDGVEGDDLQSNSRMGITAAFPVDRHNSVKLYASTGISARTGSNFDAVGLAWQYRWGGGL